MITTDNRVASAHFLGMLVLFCFVEQRLEVCIGTINLIKSAIGTTLGAIGSTVVVVDDKTGKRSLNVAPTILVVYGLSVIGCYLSHDEPFGQCVRTIISSLGG